MNALELKPHQQEAVEWLAGRRRGLVVSPAGSGKTIIAAAALRRVIEARFRARAVRVGWIANTQEQVEQAREAIARVGVEAECTVACAAGCQDWTSADVLIVDEAHHALAPSWAGQIAAAQGARWGFTATPPEDKDELARLLELFSEALWVEREEVEEMMVPAFVRMIATSDQSLTAGMDKLINRELSRRRRFSQIPEQELWGQIAFRVCIDVGIVQNVGRNGYVITKALQHATDQVLILVNKVEHGQFLGERIPGAVVCFSKMGAKARRAAMDGFRAGAIQCLVATSLADEGLDLPNANVLILACGGRSSAKTEQRTGRVLRGNVGKNHGLIYDFHDTAHPLMTKHSLARMEFYRRLGYSVGFDGERSERQQGFKWKSK